MNNTSQERGMNCRLTSAEKQELAIQARCAWHKMVANGATDETADEFRHRLALQACGRRVSEAVRADYAALSATFLAAGGQTRKAIWVAERGETEPRRIAEHKLAAALKAAGLHPGYAASICMNQFKCDLTQASTKQIWCLFYTITNRGNAKARTARPQVPAHNNMPF